MIYYFLSVALIVVIGVSVFFFTQIDEANKLAKTALNARLEFRCRNCKWCLKSKFTEDLDKCMYPKRQYNWCEHERKEGRGFCGSYAKYFEEEE